MLMTVKNLLRNWATYFCFQKQDSQCVSEVEIRMRIKFYCNDEIDRKDENKPIEPEWTTEKGFF